MSVIVSENRFLYSFQTCFKWLILWTDLNHFWEKRTADQETFAKLHMEGMKGSWKLPREEKENLRKEKGLSGLPHLIETKSKLQRQADRSFFFKWKRRFSPNEGDITQQQRKPTIGNSSLTDKPFLLQCLVWTYLPVDCQSHFLPTCLL